jgi:hypothetical protein
VRPKSALRQRSQGPVDRQHAAFLTPDDLHGQHGYDVWIDGTIQQQAQRPGTHSLQLLIAKLL